MAYKLVVFVSFTELLTCLPSNISLSGFIAGGYGYDGYYSGDILEYDPEEDSMVTVGQMTRAWHAITVVNTEQYQQWCT